MTTSKSAAQTNRLADESTAQTNRLANESTAQTKKLGIYVHIPFCVSKCAYCDFLSFANTSSELQDAYINALTNEIKTHAFVYSRKYIDNKNIGYYDEYAVNSIFIGGGTPSVLNPDQILRVLDAIRQNFNVDFDCEITIEANPNTISESSSKIVPDVDSDTASTKASEAKLHKYLQAGINRISFGAQSFDDNVLGVMGRTHIAKDIEKSFFLARNAGFKNINIDLMSATFGQDIKIWKDTLNRTIELDPEHISFYSLQIEKGTKFFDMLKAGRYENPSGQFIKLDKTDKFDKLDREMYHTALEQFEKAGYVHYEISNVAKSGYECRHNIKYWTMNDYLGVGIGAHSYIEGKRFGNIRDINEYIENAGQHGFDFVHKNDLSDDISEYVFTGLRMMKGIELGDFERKFKRTLQDVYSNEWQQIEKYIADGMLIMSDGRLRLSKTGIDISNRIMSEFML